MGGVSQKLVLIALFFGILGSSCSQNQNIGTLGSFTSGPEPTPTVSPAILPEPTPSITPSPTATTSPTATPSSYTITAARRFTYGTADVRQHVDFYSAVEDPSPRPLILFIHGGAWVLGYDAQTYESYIKSSNEMPMKNLTKNLINAGFCVGIMKYRHPKYIKKSSTATNVPYEQSGLAKILEDINSAFQVLLTQASTLKIDSSRIALMGESAGSHLATMYAYGSLTYSSQLKTVVSFYGPYDLSQPDATPSYYTYPYNSMTPRLFSTLVTVLNFGNSQSQDEDTNLFTASVYTMRAFDSATGQFIAEQASPARRTFSPVHLIEQKGAGSVPMTFAIHAANDALVNPNQINFLKSALGAQEYSATGLTQPSTTRHMTTSVSGFNHGFAPTNASLTGSIEFDRVISPMIINWFNSRLK